MARLIDADVLRQTIESKIYWGGVGLLEAIDDAPSVNAVEVIRCKDCKHYKPHNRSAHWNCQELYCCRSAIAKVKPDDFCSCLLYTSPSPRDS